MSVNQVVLVGRLGSDPELKTAASGKPYCNLRVATDRPRRPDAERPDPDWHRVKVFDGQAESCARYLSRGRLVAVEGRLQRREWRDDAGQPQSLTEVVARHVTFLGPRPAAGPVAGAPVPATAAPAAAGPSDDIPF